MNYANETLSDLAIKIPMASDLFRKNRLDFCCGGKQLLKDACLKMNININEITTVLDKLSNKEAANEARPLNEITAFIVKRYHDDLRLRLPELLLLAEKVERVHGDKPDCPNGLAAVLKDLKEEMFSHMMKEENVLFPLIDSGRGNLAFMPIKVMTSEHDSHGRELDKIHLLTQSFTPPEGACGTWRTLYAGLAELEKELMEHIHLENNILFPKALAQGESY